jgi:FkbM family methyltransferase
MRTKLSLKIKERIMRHYLIPFSSTGLESGLVNYLRRNVPINFLDIGASSGEFAQAISDYCGVRHAVLVEPQPALAAHLISRFPSEEFSIEKCAISDEDGWAEFDVLNWHYSSSLLPVNRGISGFDKIFDLRVRDRIKVRVRTLDDLMSKISWRAETIDLLKVDVQGGELSVFRGAEATLRRTRMIWTEVSFRQMYEGSALFSDIHAFLYQAGFMFLWISQGLRGENSELLEGDALFVRRDSFVIS